MLNALKTYSIYNPEGTDPQYPIDILMYLDVLCILSPSNSSCFASQLQLSNRALLCLNWIFCSVDYRRFS